MTEEIIIDGIDVSGCCYYEPKNDTGKWCDLTCTRDNAPDFRCEKMPNCHYKQLKRLEQENKELKEKVKSRENELANMAEQANMRINTYHSALEEIKNSVINYLPKENYKFARSLNPEEFELLENILTKIKEVLK